MKRLYGILGIVLLIIATCTALAAVGNLSWTPPTEREDGTPLATTEIAGYNLYIDGQKNNTAPLVGNSTTLDLAPGNYAINMTTVDTDGRESVFSTTFNLIIAAPVITAPKPPTIIQWNLSPTEPGLQ